MREMLRELGEAKGEVSPDLRAAAALQGVLMDFDIALSKAWASFEATGPEMRAAFAALQQGITNLKAATLALQRARRLKGSDGARDER
jgi:hypothetical protein